MNIKKLFLQLTEYTNPYGSEHLLENFFPKGIEEDGFGNYIMKIGDSKTIFTCHMDTACSRREKVNHVFEGDFIKTDGTTILSADDKCGMTIMLYMIYRKVPGVYYFFMGEESGCVGSELAFRRNKEFFLDYSRMISFDRRAYHSVITHQMGQMGCSTEFAQALADELNYHGFGYRPDSTGIYTDSATFIGLIPESTNLSVGYFHEHSHTEKADIKFLENLAKAACLVHWEELPIGDKGVDKYAYMDDFDEYGGYGKWGFCY